MKYCAFARCVFVLLVCAAVFPFPGRAGQTIVIDSGSRSHVYGNGTPPNGSSPATGDPNGNSVIFNGGRAGRIDVYGGYAHNTVGGDAEAVGNSVIMNGSEIVMSEIYGGYAYTVSGTAEASGNSVIIRGGVMLLGKICGGYVQGSATTATHNTVTLSSGNPGMTIEYLYGGYSDAPNGDLFTGNTLNLWNNSGIISNVVQNFEFLNFVFPATWSGTVLGTAFLGDGAGKASTITASTIGGAAPWQAGDSVTLIGGTRGLSYTQAAGQHGATLRYDWELDTASGLTATLQSVKAAPQAKALSEGFLSGLALTARGADLAAGAGTAQAARAAAAGSGLNAFAAVAGGALRHDTGSHVDMNSFSLMTGLAKGFALAPGRLALAAFFEYGNGVYDTFNAFEDAASVRGDGHAYSLGGGVLARVDFAESASGTGNFYAEASARFGSLRNEYRSGDLQDAMGNSIGGYETSSLYYGFHLGGGYLWNISEKASLDLSAAYLWTRVAGDDVTLATGDPVSFRRANSSRARVGARYVYAATDCLRPYIGAAYEHEFAGEAQASTYGYNITAPSLRGGTGIAEAGLTLAPSAALPLSFDLGVQGFVGKRQGVIGTVQARFEF